MESSPQRSLFERAERSAQSSGCLEDVAAPPESCPVDTHFARLAQAIEQEIIPRLMLAHRSPPPKVVESGAGPASASIGDEDVRHFARLVLHPDEDMAVSAIAGFRARGVPIEAIYLDLLAPTARHLGRLWEEDLCDFSDVTIGLGRLQRVLRELSPSFGRPEGPAQDSRRILLLPGPHEQHTFGLVMVSEFFRRAGWDVSGGAWMGGADAPALVAAEWFDVLGFSVSSEVHLPALADCIREARAGACNRGLAIMVGGPLFAAHPDYAGQVGADGMSGDGRDAPRLAETLILPHGGQ